MTNYDAVVVGAGPNGLAAAITLARASRSVLLIEARETVGGGISSAALTLPGFTHDLGSAVHPFGVGSHVLRSMPLRKHGLRWIYPPTAVAHPLDGGRAVLLHRAVQQTAKGLGRDGQAYYRLMAPIVKSWDHVAPAVLGPLRLPRHPLALASFGLRAIWPVTMLTKALFREEPARALLGGISAHSCLPLEQLPSAAVGLVLAVLGHTVGWPIPEGGAQRIADSMAAYFRSLGGIIRTGQRVTTLDELPSARATLLDVSPRQLLSIAGDRLPSAYQEELRRYRYGPGVFKLDWALDGPIPWANADCARAATVHVCGTLDEMAESERAPWQNSVSERPYVLLSQPSLFDPSRAPRGSHAVWAYCHVPHGSTVDMTERAEAQIERFAPGFRQRIIGRSTMGPAAMEAWNANLVGGDITGGVSDLFQLFTRPTVSLTPYVTAAEGVYICSSSTPPGPGVHGLCGYHAAQAALRQMAR